MVQSLIQNSTSMSAAAQSSEPSSSIPSESESLALECEICAEPFEAKKEGRRPRILPCAHTFCEECIGKVIQDRTIPCPRCRHETKSISSLNDIKLNYSLIEFMEFIEQHPLLQRNGKAGSVVPIESCAACPKAATWYCADEQATLCDEHKQQSHALPFQQKHRLCPIADKLKLQHAEPPMCDKHRLPQLLWCEKDETICCPTCASHGSHKGHKTELIEAIAGGVKDELKKKMDETRKEQQQLDEEGSRLLAIEQQLKEKQGAVTIEINQACDELIQKIERSRKELIEQLDGKTAAALKEASLRMMSLSLCRSQGSVALEKGSVCLELPDHQVLQHCGDVHKSHSAAAQARTEYGKEPALEVGFNVRGLKTTDVVQLQQVQFDAVKGARSSSNSVDGMGANGAERHAPVEANTSSRSAVNEPVNFHSMDLQSVLDAMRIHQADTTMMAQACGALQNLTVNDDNRETIARLGGIDLLLQLIRQHEEDAALMTQACGALQNLPANADNDKTIVRLGGIDLLLQLMRRHGDNATLMTRACGALQNLPANADNGKTIVRLGGTDLLLQLMRRHGDNAALMENVCGALQNLPADQDVLTDILIMRATLRKLPANRARTRVFPLV